MHMMEVIDEYTQTWSINDLLTISYNQIQLREILTNNAITNALVCMDMQVFEALEHKVYLN